MDGRAQSGSHGQLRKGQQKSPRKRQEQVREKVREKVRKSVRETTQLTDPGRQAPVEQMSLFPSAKRTPIPSGRPSGASASFDTAGFNAAGFNAAEFNAAVTPHARQLPGRRVLVNPHLLAARRLAKKMRQLPNHSSEETRVGLAICQQLKAFLQEGSKPATRH